MELIYIIIFTVLYLIGRAIYGYVDYRWSNQPVVYTICPKCEYYHRRISGSYYECDKCGAFFTVDKMGQAHIPSIKKMLIGIAFGIFWIAGTILTFIHFEEIGIIKVILLGSIGLIIISESIYRLMAFNLRHSGNNTSNKIKI